MAIRPNAIRVRKLRRESLFGLCDSRQTTVSQVSQQTALSPEAGPQIKQHADDPNAYCSLVGSSASQHSRQRLAKSVMVKGELQRLSASMNSPLQSAHHRSFGRLGVDRPVPSALQRAAGVLLVHRHDQGLDLKGATLLPGHWRFLQMPDSVTYVLARFCDHVFEQTSGLLRTHGRCQLNGSARQSCPQSTLCRWSCSGLAAWCDSVLTPSSHFTILTLAMTCGRSGTP
jgi:hypothetical protein